MSDTTVKAGITIPARMFVETDTTDEEALWDAIEEKWDNMSDEERAELISEVKGWEITENLAYIDEYEGDEVQEVLYEY